MDHRLEEFQDSDRASGSTTISLEPGRYSPQLSHSLQRPFSPNKNPPHTSWGSLGPLRTGSTSFGGTSVLGGCLPPRMLSEMDVPRRAGCLQRLGVGSSVESGCKVGGAPTVGSKPSQISLDGGSSRVNLSTHHTRSTLGPIHADTVSALAPWIRGGAPKAAQEFVFSSKPNGPPR